MMPFSSQPMVKSMSKLWRLGWTRMDSWRESFTFTGTSGTTAHVEAHFGDKTSSKEITF